MTRSGRIVQRLTSKKTLTLLAGMVIVAVVIGVSATIAILVNGESKSSSNSSQSNGKNNTAEDTTRNNTSPDTTVDNKNAAIEEAKRKRRMVNLDEIAADISSSMNLNVTPCENFWEFACGNAGDDISGRGYIHDRATKLFNNILAHDSLPDEPTSLISIKNLYKSCIEQDHDKMNLIELKKILDLLGGWPVLEGQSWAEKNVTQLLHNMEKLGFTHIDSLLAFEGIYKRYSVSSELDRIVEMAKEMGANETLVEKELREPFQVSLRQFLDDTKNGFLFTKGQLIIANLQFLPKRTAFNFALLHLISEFIIRLPKNTTKRQEACNRFIESRFTNVQGILYLREYFDENKNAINTKNAINKLLIDLKDQIKSEFSKFFHGKVDNESEQKVFAVFEKLQFSLNLPEQYPDDKLIQEHYYNGLVIQNDDFLRGCFNYAQYALNESTSIDNSKINSLFPYGLRSSYSSTSIPSNPLRVVHSLFADNMPKYINYGSIFADDSRNIGLLDSILEFSELKTTDTCLVSHILKVVNETSDTEGTFMYNRERYYPNGTIVPPSINWTLQPAYLLYKKWLQNHGREPVLGSLANYTNEQMFWISYAHSKCEKLNNPESSLRMKHFLYNVLRSEDFHRDFQCENKCPLK